VNNTEGGSFIRSVSKIAITRSAVLVHLAHLVASHCTDLGGGEKEKIERKT